MSLIIHLTFWKKSVLLNFNNIKCKALVSIIISNVRHCSFFVYNCNWNTINFVKLESLELGLGLWCLTPLSEKKGNRLWSDIPLTSLTLPHVCACPKPRTGFRMSCYVFGFICVQWVKVRGNCSFCWYWWNCWPS